MKVYVGGKFGRGMRGLGDVVTVQFPYVDSSSPYAGMSPAEIQAAITASPEYAAITAANKPAGLDLNSALIYGGLGFLAIFFVLPVLFGGRR